MIMVSLTFKRFVSLMPASDCIEDGLYPVVADDKKFLIIRENGNTYVIQNACGHFGTPLNQGDVKDGVIACPHHGIKFSLKTGEITNRPWENCDPITVYEVSVSDGFLGVVI